MQTGGVGQTSVDVWVATYGLYCHSLDAGRLITNGYSVASCKCLIVFFKNSETVGTYIE